MDFKDRLTSLPDATRIAVLTAWRGRARGAAVFAGVFLASLVITTVLAYGSGLMSAFLEEGLKGEEYDYRLEFHSSSNLRSDDPALLEELCIEILKIDNVLDCSISAGRQAAYGAGFIGDRQTQAQPLQLVGIPNPRTTGRQLTVIARSVLSVRVAMTASCTSAILLARYLVNGRLAARKL